MLAVASLMVQSKLRTSVTRRLAWRAALTRDGLERVEAESVEALAQRQGALVHHPEPLAIRDNGQTHFHDGIQAEDPERHIDEIRLEMAHITYTPPHRLKSDLTSEGVVEKGRQLHIRVEHRQRRARRIGRPLNVLLHSLRLQLQLETGGA